MTVLDYYSLLEIKPDASLDEIKKAFRVLAQRYHPDSGSESSNNDMFLRVKEAYSVLSDPDARAEYDKSFFREAELKNETRKPSSGGRRVQEEKKNREKAKPAERGSSDDDASAGVAAADRAWSFSDDSAGSSSSTATRRSAKDDSGSSWFGFNKRESKQNRVRGKYTVKSDRVFQVTVDVLESLRGAVREIAVKDYADVHRLKVQIPAGVEPGTILHIRERPGDPTDDTMLPVRVLVTNHPYLSRVGLDLYLTVPVTIAEAFKGVEIEVPTYESVVRVKIPPLTDNSSALRLKNKGIVDEAGTAGDFYVRPRIVAPESSTEAAVAAAESLDSLYTTPVRAELPDKIC